MWERKIPFPKIEAPLRIKLHATQEMSLEEICKKLRYIDSTRIN
jgi:hypothetical protein